MKQSLILSQNKLKDHFTSTESADIKAFLNTFMHLLKQHIKRKTKDQDQSQFTEEIINEYGLFILHRVIPGLATCDTLEDALKQEESANFEELKSKFTVNFKSAEEEK